MKRPQYNILELRTQHNGDGVFLMDKETVAQDFWTYVINKKGDWVVSCISKSSWYTFYICRILPNFLAYWAPKLENHKLQSLYLMHYHPIILFYRMSQNSRIFCYYHKFVNLILQYTQSLLIPLNFRFVLRVSIHFHHVARDQFFIQEAK